MRSLSTRSIVSIAGTLAFVFGCSSSGSDPSPEPSEQDSLLDLEPPDDGFQVRTVGETIQAGEDIEYCEVVLLPGTADETYYFNSFDIEMTEFSHHLLVYGIQPGSATDAALDVGYSTTCTGAHSIAESFADLSNVAGSQERYKSFTYPEGIGKKLQGGSKLLFNYHYLNTSTEAVPAGHAMNFHTTTADRVRKIAQTMAFVNLTIDTPAHSEGSFLGECTMSQNAMLGSLTRHTHRWGTEFSVWHVGGDKDGQHIWTSDDWELDTDHVFDEPEMVEEGTGFRFQCDFDNTTDNPLRFGPKATDEMCILFGQWWVENEGDEVTPQICIMVGEPDADGVSRGFFPDPSMFTDGMLPTP